VTDSNAMHYSFWLPVIMLRFAHVIFIEINVDKIINAFTKNFCVNVVNVYHIHIYAEIYTTVYCVNHCSKLVNCRGVQRGSGTQ